MSAVTARVSNDLRNRIVAVLREDRDVRNIGSLADQLEAAIRSAEPAAWLRHGEETPVQNVPFGAMWISDKDDPRSFPVYDCPQQPALSVAVKALDAHTMQKLREALRFSASRSVMSSADEKRILSALSALVQDAEELNEEMSLAVALDFADNPRPYHTLQAPADTNGELYRALKTIAAAYRSAQVQDVAAIAQLNAIVDAWEALPGGRQVRNSDVEAWLRKHMAPAINAIRAFLNRPLPDGA